MEARVQAHAGKIQDLYDNAPAGYHSLGPDGTIIMVNQTELSWLGYTREELIGRPFTDMLTESSCGIFYEHFPLFQQCGQIHNLELEVIRRDGSTFPVLLSATAIYDDAGTFLMSRSTLFDITERKWAEKALRIANAEMERALRLKDTFLANMSHELRTPLNTILSLSEILIEGIYEPLNERQQSALQRIETSSLHLLGLINDILDLSKVEAERLDLQIEAISVFDVCQASLQFVKEMALKKQIQLSYELSSELTTMQADAKRLKQMLVNLLSNAVKFTPDGGTVRLDVHIAPKADFIHFAVRDTGIGIAADDLNRLFRPFVQVDSRLNRQQEGTGLGLTLVRRLAELHGGTIAVESEVGTGSCFTIALPYHRHDTESLAGPRTTPAAEDVAHAAARMPGEDRPSQVGGPHPTSAPMSGRVLLVDDNEDGMASTLDYLQVKGYHVSVAHNGREALDLAERVHPDVILIDIQMPEMDGLEATRRLRSRPGTVTTPIIALTALAMSGDRERCLAAGADDYFSKPVSLSQLVTRIEQLRHMRIGRGG